MVTIFMAGADRFSESVVRWVVVTDLVKVFTDRYGKYGIPSVRYVVIINFPVNIVFIASKVVVLFNSYNHSSCYCLPCNMAIIQLL